MEESRVARGEAPSATRRGLSAKASSAWSLVHDHMITIVSVTVGLLAWEAIAKWIITDRLFFASFTQTVGKLAEIITTGMLWPHLYVSSIELAIGLALAVVVGIAIGSLMAVSTLVDKLLDPWVAGLYATPLVALMPFFILAFGIHIASKAAMVFVLAVFPVLVSTRTGILAVDEVYLEVGRSFNAPRGRFFVEILIPSALPFLLSGLRLAIGRALVAVVVGELYFAKAGVGFLVANAGQTFNSALLFAGVMIFSLAGIVMTGTLKYLEQKIAPWRGTTTT